jgi:hypothetical protein
MVYNSWRYILIFLCVLWGVLLPESEGLCSVLSDPNVPDGEKIVWRALVEEKYYLTAVTWRVASRDGKTVYEITTDTGETKQAKYIVDKSDLRLLWCNVVRNDEDGRFEVTIDVKGKHQYLAYDFKGKSKSKKIDHDPNGYNGMIMGFCLRGFPFSDRQELKLKMTPPFRPGMPLWAWKMWKGRVKLLGTEEVTVSAGTFDCYKLEVGASGGLIKMFSDKYYFWFTREPPHRFVKYESEDGESMTELFEEKYTGKVKESPNPDK